MTTFKISNQWWKLVTQWWSGYHILHMSGRHLCEKISCGWLKKPKSSPTSRVLTEPNCIHTLVLVKGTWTQQNGSDPTNNSSLSTTYINIRHQHQCGPTFITVGNLIQRDLFTCEISDLVILFFFFMVNFENFPT